MTVARQRTEWLPTASFAGGNNVVANRGLKSECCRWQGNVAAGTQAGEDGPSNEA